MGRISKFTVEQKLQAVQDYNSGKRKMKEISSDLGVHPSGKVVYQWVSLYDDFGEEALHPKKYNKRYDKETKAAAIHEYLTNKGSYGEIARKYFLSSPSILENWVAKYGKTNDVVKIIKNNKAIDKKKALKKLREENQQLKRKINLMEKENTVLKQMEKTKLDGKKQKPKYIVIKELHERHSWSINWMCQVLEVTRAGYYKWLERIKKKEQMMN